jgi:hypothetical protein
MSEKQFAIPGEQMQRLVSPMGWCFASDSITVEGRAVGYMYREIPDNEGDSGWRFFAGDEPQEYADDPDNFAMYDVNTVANYDPDIIPYLDVPPPCAFGKIPEGHEYREEDLPCEI